MSVILTLCKFGSQSTEKINSIYSITLSPNHPVITLTYDPLTSNFFYHYPFTHKIWRLNCTEDIASLKKNGNRQTYRWIL